MAPLKHNLFDAEGSENGDSDLGYDSDEAGKESRVSRAPKRRRTAENDEGSSDGESEAEEEATYPTTSVKEAKPTNTAQSTDQRFQIDDDFQDDVLDEEEEDVEGGTEDEPGAVEKKSKPTKVRKLAAPKKVTTKSGVVYLSRVPPFMKPQTVKHLLTSFGEIGRIFLTPEDPASHTRRVKSGGNKKKTFGDGWVEFVHKKDAKIAAETLNAQIIGGKKGGYYYDDIWNMKYLQGFKWHHLTEQIANENAERASRLRTEISQTTRENKRFIENVERAKMQETKDAKKRKRDEKNGETDPAPAVEAKKNDHRVFKSQFRQSEVRSKSAKTNTGVEQPAEVQRVLSKIF